MFLTEEFLEFEAETLEENAFTEWLGYFFKGTSDEANQRIKEAVQKEITSKDQAEEILEEIEEAIEKVEDRGDGTHTAGNFAMIFIPGLSVGGLLLKHIVKVYGFKKARKNAIKLLKAQRDALIIHMDKKGWKR